MDKTKKNTRAKRRNPFEDVLIVRKSGNGSNEIEEKPKQPRYEWIPRKKVQKWERHAEAAVGFYFHINGPKYCYVTEYQSKTLVHVRIYDQNPKTEKLIPTKTGCCLKTDEWHVLREVGPDVIAMMEDCTDGDIMRRPLGQTSNWYLLIGADERGDTAISIRLLAPSRNQKTNEMCSTTKGLTFNQSEWETFVSMFEEIDEAVTSIESSFTE